MDPIAEFAAIASAPEHELDLARASLAIASGANSGIDVDHWLGELDSFATGIGDLDDLRRRLFVDLGFTGDTRDFSNPANSFLDQVIERRRGIPITLSVVTMEVGARAGVELQGIGMPGHFLVREVAAGAYLDPFNAGEYLDEQQCEALFRSSTGARPDVPFGPHLLPVVTKQEILARMLANLKEIYRARGSPQDLEWVLRMRLELPQVPEMEVVELGEALALQGRWAEGAEEISRRARMSPEQSEALSAAARALRARLN